MTNNYFFSDKIPSLQKEFYQYMSNKGINLTLSTMGFSIRDLMFNFFKQKIFLDCYYEIAKDGACKVGMLGDGLMLQTTPTPRVFRPGDHGTSFHCDYWYGHGRSAHTIWIPLTDINEKNTFRLCAEDKNSDFYEKLERQNGFIHSEDELVTNSYPAIPPPNHGVIFNSKVIHGSPLNESDKERISIDFRITMRDDKSSTKDVENYYAFSNGVFNKNLDRFERRRFLKYICGGAEKNTNAQHLLIESTAKYYNINVVAQEAEIERFGHPMLLSYLNGLAKTKGFDGIIIASKSILSSDVVQQITKAEIPVYSCLENIIIG
jgi:hypothetical protein